MFIDPFPFDMSLVIILCLSLLVNTTIKSLQVDENQEGEEELLCAKKRELANMCAYTYELIKNAHIEQNCFAQHF